jgi:hypothetical protein
MTMSNRIPTRLASVLVAAVALLSMSPALAASAWKGPGWYLMDSYGLGFEVYGGPYATQPLCEANIKDNERDSFVCEYYATEADLNQKLNN